jgi:zinc protease
MKVTPILALLAGLTLLAAPAGAEVFKPDSFRLANGLDVVVVSDHRAPVVTHMVYYRVGGADEPQGFSGVAHFLEHLMFKGTATRASGEFSRIVSRIGGQENAFTSYDYTGYYQTVAADQLETVMALEADRMANLALDANEVAAERQVVLEERRSRVENSPEARLREQINAVHYLSYPYRVPLIGWPEEIAALTR